MEENKKVKGYPLFEKFDSDRNLKDDTDSTTGDGHPERSTTGDGHPPRYGKDDHSTTGDGHAPRYGEHKESFVDKMMDKLTGEDHSQA